MESVGFELCMQVVMSLHKKAAKTRNIYMQEVRTLLYVCCISPSCTLFSPMSWKDELAIINPSKEIRILNKDLATINIHRSPPCAPINTLFVERINNKSRRSVR